MANSGYGQAQPDDFGSEYAAIAFIVRQMIAEMSIMALVQVKAVHGGGVAAIGTVDVQPLVSQIDGNGYPTKHGTVPGIPWSRVSGGTNAIICDPQVGDVGYVVTSDRDTSSVRNNNGAASQPGSRRRNDIADGVYAGGLGFAVTPTQYLIFTDTGCRLVDANGNSLSFSNTGFSLQDQAGNSIVSTSSGMTLTIPSGNKIIMASGFVNIVAPVLQVNGVPITVP